jgi:hypothetical protein
MHPTGIHGTVFAIVFATLMFTQVAVAGTPLGGGELESACRTCADQAIRDSQEWQNLGCKDTLKTAPQLFDLDSKRHFSRCKDTLGTEIANDQAKRKAFLDQCRAARGMVPGPPATPGRGAPGKTSPGAASGMPGTGGTTPQTTGNPQGKNSGRQGDAWEITLLDLNTLQQYHYVYALSFTGDRFVGRYLDPPNNKSTFAGQMTRDGRIRYTQTDKAYKAYFAARNVGGNRYEGAAYDSRGSIFLISLMNR